MKIIITKEDLEDVERAVSEGCCHSRTCRVRAADNLWGKIRLCIENDLQLEYHKEWEESEESMAVGMITRVTRGCGDE